MTVKDCGVVLVTTNSEEEAKNIARMLVSEKLAACVNIFPIHSIYRWQGEICEDGEWQLIIKTNLKLFPQLAERIKSLHSYQTPEIIALPLVDGSQSYIEWLQDSVIHS